MIGKGIGLTLLPDPLPADIDFFRLYQTEVTQHRQIRQIPRRNGALIFQAVRLRRIERRHPDGFHRTQPQLDGPPDAEVDVAVFPDVVQVPIVGAEQKPIRGELLPYDAADDGVQIPGCRPLPDLDIKAQLHPLQSLLKGAALVIGGDARQPVGI